MLTSVVSVLGKAVVKQLLCITIRLKNVVRVALYRR